MISRVECKGYEIDVQCYDVIGTGVAAMIKLLADPLTLQLPCRRIQDAIGRLAFGVGAGSFWPDKDT